jgi:hypothetical protein
VLLGTLVPPNMLVEDDSLWTFESLLRVGYTASSPNTTKSHHTIPEYFTS